MPLNLHPNVFASGSVPAGWASNPRGTIKDPVGNKVLNDDLRQPIPGRWQKVIKKANPGEIHYFEYASDHVADGIYFP